MSGATWGGVIGAVIGSFIPGVGTALGWAIGSAIGGYIDPEQFSGPRLQDARTQTSRDGVAIPFGWGTFPLAGNIIWQQPNLTEHKNKERQGKGGPEVTSFTYTRSYAIGLCDGPITGILQIKRNGKLVYDARDDATLEEEYQAALGPVASIDDVWNRIRLQRSMNSRFINICEIYLGDETQTPDPTIESYKGVGNVPAYRGLAYIVVTDDDVTDLQGAIPQYEFVVADCGTVSSNPASSAVQWLALADAGTSGSPNFRAIRTSVDGEDWSSDPIPYGGSTQYQRIYASGDSILLTAPAGTNLLFSNDRGASFTPGTLPTHDGPARGFYSDGYWFITGGNSHYVWRSVDGVTYTQPNTTTQAKFHDLAKSGERLFGATSFGAPPHVSVSEDNGDTWAWVDTAGPTLIGPRIACNGDTIVMSGGSGISFKVELVFSQDGGDTWAQAVTPFSTYVTSGSALHYSESAGVFVAASNNGEVAYSADGENWTLATTPLAVGQQVYEFTSGDGFIVGACADATFIRSNNGIDWEAFPLSPTFSTSEDVLDVHFIGTNSGMGIPDAPGWYVDAAGNVVGPAYDTVTPCDGVELSTIAGELCELEGLTSDEYDASQLTDLVPGFRIANEGDAASAIAALMPAYFFDVGEWDGKVRFIKRGGASSFAINGDDLVERDGDPFERERLQEPELLRRVTVGYIDPAASYGPTTQKWERRAGTVQAKGEASMELPLTLVSDEAATIAKKRGLAAWGEPEKQKCNLPYRLAAITPTDVGTYTDSDGLVFTLRAMQAEDDSGIRYMEFSTNSAEAYGATATGVPPKPPTVTNGNLRGPTVFKAMNLDSLRAQDNVPGMYFAATGILAGWAGCVIKMSKDAGATFEPIVTITSPATMGYLTSSIGTSTEPIPIFLYAGAQISSVTVEQIAAGVNASAIITNDVPEIVQPQTATALGDGAYELTDVARGVKDSIPASHADGDAFVLLDYAVVFVPIDSSLAGQTLVFRAVTIGTSSDAAPQVSVVYEPPTFVLDGGGA